MATKKAGGSTKNGRDSQSKRRGVKLFAGQSVLPGGIIVRQKGTKFFPGQNTRMGRDFTIFAVAPGKVQFTEKKRQKYDGRVFRNVHVHVTASS